MSLGTRLLLGTGAVAAALGVGFAMQSRVVGTHPVINDTPVSITDVQFTAAPALPSEQAQPAALSTSAAPALPQAGTAAPLPSDEPDTPRLGALSCDMTMTAAVKKSAMVALDLSAPCATQSAFTLHHGGVSFGGETDAKGLAALTVPALNSAAIFIAAFESGDGAVAMATVPEVSDITRTVLTWRGDTGLSLHAREGGAAYGSDGHLSRATTASQTAAEHAERGFFTVVDAPSGAQPLHAEIYTAPAKSALPAVVTIEAEITAQNCGTGAMAQLLTIQPSVQSDVEEVHFAAPGCDAIGDFLVLKNPAPETKLALNEGVSH